MQRTQCNENPDFAICEIAIESEPSDSTCDLDRRSNSRQIGTRGTSESVEDRCKEYRGSRESAYRGSKGRMHIIIVNPEIPTRGIVTVT
jgi:hypothetical protein